MKQGEGPGNRSQTLQEKQGRGCDRIHSLKVDSEAYSMPGTVLEMENTWEHKTSLGFCFCRNFAKQNKGGTPLKSKQNPHNLWLCSEFKES